MSLKLDIVLTLAICLPSVKSLTTLDRRVSSELPKASEVGHFSVAIPSPAGAREEMATQAQRVTKSPTQSALHPQGQSLIAVNTSTIALDAFMTATQWMPGDGPSRMEVDAKAADKLIDPAIQSSQVATTSLLTTDIDTSSTMSSASNHREMTNQTAHSQSIQSAPKVVKVSSSTLQPSTITNTSTLKNPSKTALLPYDISTPMSTLPIEARPGFLSDTHTITHSTRLNSRSQDIFPSSPTLSPNSTITLGSGIPPIVLFIKTSVTQTLLVSGSSIPLLPSHATLTPESSKKTSYNNTQTLTPDSVITVSGTTISLAPGKDAIVVGSSTGPLIPSVTASIGSGPNGTEVQKFAGNAVGARDQLWSSSILLLVAFAILLRL